MPEENEIAFVALGSNLGDSAKIIIDCFASLQLLTDHPLLRSSLWQTAPIDCPPGSPPFINAVAGLVPRHDEAPQSLRARLHAIETDFGRAQKKTLNEPRLLDLDLLAFGRQQIASPSLTLPHPRAHLRRFVLQPWSEIAPNFVLPGANATIAQLLARLPTQDPVKKINPPD
jgi:2-amino-4-hydroxy-6-hydroxymethyldihydropteridine diphosphokinase